LPNRRNGPQNLPLKVAHKEEIPMITLLDVWERAQNGPRVQEKEWNMGLFKKLTEITKKYDIKRQGKELVNTDDEILDRAIEAAIEFVSAYGVYCRDLYRVIHFSEQEVREAIQEAPSEIKVGEGNERTTITQKKVEDRRKRNVCAGHHAPFSLDIGPLVTKCFASLPRVDYMEGFNFKEVEGREISNPGIEVYAQIRAIEAMRDGIKRAGKPGIAIALYPINTSPVNMIAPLDPERGLRRSDGALLSPLPDFKIESGFITTAIVYDQYGMKLKINGSPGMCGATYVGSPQNSVIEGISKAIVSWMCYRDTIHNNGVYHTDDLAGKTPVLDEVSWARTVMAQTICNKTNFIGFASCSFVNEIGTVDSLKESLIRVIRDTVCGNNIWIGRNMTPSVNCGQTPLEMKLAIEVSDAVIEMGLKRDQIEDLIGDWMRELHRKPIPDKKGIRITDIYDLTSNKPREEYRVKYEKIKEELVRRGVPLK
jgi:methylamine--corrinoid protein Co-methyltransferase